MIITKTETRTVTEEVTVGRICDVCKKPMPRVPMYNVREVTITAERGHHYPGSGRTECTTLDCCWECWEFKLRPAMEAAGAEFREEPREY